MADVRNGRRAAPILAPLAHRVTSAHTASHVDPDPRLTGAYLRALDLLTTWFSPDVRNADNVPASGPVIVAGNHSCLTYMPDAAVILRAVAGRRRDHPPTYTLAYDLLFAIPGFGSLIRRLGVMPADNPEAEAALRQEAAVVVFPGGDHDACRPWSERDRIAFGGHQGFVRLALRTGAPLVPAVAHGAHHGMVIVARGETLARALHLGDVRVKVLPLLLGPAGVLPVLAPPPLPARITVEFLPSPDWSRHPPEDADDPVVVQACYDEVIGLMQATLDRLARERPHPVADGLARLGVRGLRLPVH